MDYFTDLLATFLDLDRVRTLAVYGGSEIVLGDMVIFHIVISPACEIADTRYYRAWVSVGKRETLYLSYAIS